MTWTIALIQGRIENHIEQCKLKESETLITTTEKIEQAIIGFVKGGSNFSEPSTARKIKKLYI